MARVVILGTGGTIASRYSEEHGSVIANMGSDQLVELLGALAPDIDVAAEEFSNVGSYRIDLPMAFALVRRAAELLDDPDVMGVIVTHGTDTLEESAYLADLLISSDKPCVFTGSQLHADEFDTDGPRNLADAIRVAACPDARGLGALVVFGQEIHAARDATKTHSYRMGTFASAEHGKLGEVDLDLVRFQRRTIRRGTVSAGRIETQIDLIKVAMGSDDRLIKAALAGGARGLVIEAFGRGNAPPSVTETVVEAARNGIPVAITSRSPQGRVRGIYGAGGGADLVAGGAIFCGDLSSVKARILLALLVGAEADSETIRETMEKHGN